MDWNDCGRCSGTRGRHWSWWWINEELGESELKLYLIQNTPKPIPVFFLSIRSLASLLAFFRINLLKSPWPQNHTSVIMNQWQLRGSWRLEWQWQFHQEKSWLEGVMCSIGSAVMLFRTLLWMWVRGSHLFFNISCSEYHPDFYSPQLPDSCRRGCQVFIDQTARSGEEHPIGEGTFETDSSFSTVRLACLTISQERLPVYSTKTTSSGWPTTTSTPAK